MNTPLSRLQHDLSFAPGIPDSYRLFGEGPTVSTYGDLRAVVGLADSGLAAADNNHKALVEALRPLIAKCATYGWNGVESTMFRVTSSEAKALCDLADRSVAQPHPDVSGLVEGVKQVHSDLQFLAIACEKNDPKAEISIRVSDALAVIQDRIAPLLAAFQSRQEESA